MEGGGNSKEAARESGNRPDLSAFGIVSVRTMLSLDHHKDNLDDRWPVTSYHGNPPALPMTSRPYCSFLFLHSVCIQPCYFFLAIHQSRRPEIHHVLTCCTPCEGRTAALHHVRAPTGCIGFMHATGGPLLRQGETQEGRLACPSPCCPSPHKIPFDSPGKPCR
jgi:hypothetical protein